MCSQEWEVILEGREKSDRLQGFKEGSLGRRRGRPRGSTCGRRGRPRGSTCDRRDSSAVDSDYLPSNFDFLK